MADLATAVTVLDANGRAGVPSLLISGPGMGKSSLVRGVAAADGVLCKTVLGSLREPSDFAGLPVVREHGVTLEAPAWAKELVAGGGGYLFLDELTTSPPAVQAAMLAVALDLTVGDVQLPKGTRVIAGRILRIALLVGTSWKRRWRIGSAMWSSHRLSMSGWTVWRRGGVRRLPRVRWPPMSSGLRWCAVRSPALCSAILMRWMRFRRRLRRPVVRGRRVVRGRCWRRCCRICGRTTTPRSTRRCSG